jgi:hypothetical protein
MDISQNNLRELLNSEDIEGLLALGAPDDEYADEVRILASALSQIDGDDIPEDAVAEVVRRVWIRAFGPFTDADIERRSAAFRHLAHEIQARSSSPAGAASTHPSR